MTTLPYAEARRTPPLGGFSTTLLALGLRRILRNRRTVIFTLVLPAAFFLLFGTAADFKSERVGAGNLTAYVMISMAVYGAMLATTSGGAMVSVERAVGRSRQLRLTPLNPLAYVAVKLAVAMSLGLASVLVVCAVGRFAGAELPTGRLVAAAFLAWSCALVFAAFGLFMGYLLPSENVMQLADAVRRVHQGLRVLDPNLAAESLAQGDTPLTTRETDVLSAARDGATVAAIATRLFLSEGTVRNHLSGAIQKTGARTGPRPSGWPRRTAGCSAADPACRTVVVSAVLLEVHGRSDARFAGATTRLEYGHGFVRAPAGSAHVDPGPTRRATT